MITNELDAEGHTVLLGRKPAMEKIASFLLDLSERRRSQGEDPALLHLPMTRNDIGDYLGLSTETVSRTITHLRSMDVIALDQRHDLGILDDGCLAALAEADENGLTA